MPSVCRDAFPPAALQTRLRHGMNFAVTFFFWNDRYYIRSEASGVALPNGHTAARAHTSMHTYIQTLQLVGWHASACHTAWTRRLPICHVFNSEVHYFGINVGNRKGR